MNFGGQDVCGVVDHVGVAVKSIERASSFYVRLGLVGGCIETIAHEGVRLSMFGEGQARIELLEPFGEESALSRFLERRGEGLHHVGLRVVDLDQVCEEMAGRGVRLVGDGAMAGAGGHRYRFVHPESTGGVLVELVEVRV